jgi:hypothetical protein
MNWINRSALALAVGASLCAGGPLTAAVTDVPRPARLDADHWKFKHMHEALAALHEAHKDLEDADDIFHGHKQDALDHIDAAMHAIHDGLKEQSDDEAVLPSVAHPASPLEDHFPHVRHAQERLKEAKRLLEAAEPVFAGHRDEAISHVDKALRQLDDALHDAGA